MVCPDLARKFSNNCSTTASCHSYTSVFTLGQIQISGSYSLYRHVSGINLLQFSARKSISIFPKMLNYFFDMLAYERRMLPYSPSFCVCVFIPAPVVYRNTWTVRQACICFVLWKNISNQLWKSLYDICCTCSCSLPLSLSLSLSFNDSFSSAALWHNIPAKNRSTRARWRGLRRILQSARFILGFDWIKQD